jgi:hypothetical protein
MGAVFVAGTCAHCAAPFIAVTPPNDPVPRRFCGPACKSNHHCRDRRRRVKAREAAMWGEFRDDRALLERMCKGKIRHNPYTALAHAVALQRRRPVGGPLETYECPVCGAWHVGHPTPPERVERARVVGDGFRQHLAAIGALDVLLAEWGTA